MAGGVAKADVIAGTQRNVLGWDLAAYDHSGRGFSHCGMFAAYRSGISNGIGRLSNPAR
jgi:hypothetical protein